MNFAMPRTIEELLRVLRVRDGAFLCAGGTDLMIRLRGRRQFHYSLIDLTHIPEIAKIREEDGGIRIGAAVTMDQLEHSDVIHRWVPALGAAASMVGSTQIRNRATVGGNVANASQSSDLTPVLLAYEALAAVGDETGEIRIISVDELVVGLGKTNLKETEAILWFDIRKSSALSGFAKIGSRKTVAISKVNVCIKAELKEGRMERVAVLLGAVGPKARRSPIIEEALEGEELRALDAEALKKAVYVQIEENIPDRSSKHYKKPAAFGIVCDALEALEKLESLRSTDRAENGAGTGGRPETPVNPKTEPISESWYGPKHTGRGGERRE